MPEGHTSDNLKRILLDLAKEWGLPQDVPVFIVTDNARMVKYTMLCAYITIVHPVCEEEHSEL